MKRPAPAEDVGRGGRAAKRARIYHGIRCKQLCVEEALRGAQDEEFFQSQLMRCISLTLSAVGFSGATAEALEAFRAEVEEYIKHFTSQIVTAMLSNRRTQPTPQDFTLALAASGFRSSQLRPHIALRAPPSITQPPLELLPPEPPPPPSLEAVLGPKLSGAAEKARRPFIPRHFPNLPSRHTWQSTPTFSERETDPRKIRERAAAEGVQAEKALRKLMAARAHAYAGGRRQMPNGVVEAQQSERQRRSDMIWRETLRAVHNADREARRLFEMENPEWYGGRDEDANDEWGLGVNGELDGDMETETVGLQNGMVVNYERKYWRQAARAKT